MIPEWLSFQNEFIPSPYISLYLFTWYRNEISSPHNSFRNELIPVFNRNEILVLVWYFILVSCKLKTNSVPRWKRKPCSLERVAHAYRFQDGGQNGRFQDGWVGRFCHVNAVRTSFWNETHSGMKLILVSCEQPLILADNKLHVFRLIKYRWILSHKQLDLNNAKCTSGFKFYNEFREFWHH